MNAKYPSLLRNHTVIYTLYSKSDCEIMYVLNYETVHMSTFRNFLLKLQNPMLSPAIQRRQNLTLKLNKIRVSERNHLKSKLQTCHVMSSIAASRQADVQLVADFLRRVRISPCGVRCNHDSIGSSQREC